jgi:hypothetical protein
LVSVIGGLATLDLATKFRSDRTMGNIVALSIRCNAAATISSPSQPQKPDKDFVFITPTHVTLAVRDIKFQNSPKHNCNVAHLAVSRLGTSR